MEKAPVISNKEVMVQLSLTELLIHTKLCLKGAELFLLRKRTNMSSSEQIVTACYPRVCFSTSVAVVTMMRNIQVALVQIWLRVGGGAPSSPALEEELQP